MQVECGSSFAIDIWPKAGGGFGCGILWEEQERPLESQKPPEQQRLQSLHSKQCALLATHTLHTQHTLHTLHTTHYTHPAHHLYTQAVR